MRAKLFLLCFFSAILSFGQADPQPVIRDKNGNSSALFSCSNRFSAPYNLSALFPSYNFTDSYTVTSASYTPYDFTSGKASNIYANGNNGKYISADIGFTFCFYGTSYSKLAIGTYGLLSFLDADSNYIFPKFSQQLPNPYLPLNSIFGAYQEGLSFDGSNGSDIYVQTAGSAPYRKFIVTFYNGVRIFAPTNPSCGKLRSTTQIVLNETTNVINIFIDKIPNPALCTGSSYSNSLVGIQNSSGTSGVAAPGRNTGTWFTGQEAYTFSPSGYQITPSSVLWKDPSGNSIGTAPTLSLSNFTAGDYTAEANYSLCSGNLKMSAKYSVAADPLYPVAQDATEVICPGETFSKTFSELKLEISADPGSFNISFFDDKGSLQNDSAIPTVGKIYKAVVSSKTDTSCSSTSKLQVISANVPATVSLCSDQKKSWQQSGFLLNDLLPYILGKDTKYSGKVNFYLKNDPNTPLTVISVPESAAETDLLVEFPGCSKQPLAILWSSTESSKAQEGNAYICYSAFNPKPKKYTVKDLATNPRYIREMVQTMKPVAPHWFFKESDYSEANKPKDSMDYTKSIDTVQLTPNGTFSTQRVWVRFESANCYSVRALNLHLVSPKNTAATPKLICDTGNDGTEDVQLGGQGSDVYNYFYGGQDLQVKYFSDAAHTNPQITKTTLSGTAEKLIFTELTFSKPMTDSTNCVVSDTIRLKLTTVPVVNQKISVNKTNLCDTNANGYELFDATSQQKDIYTGPENFNYEYYSSYDPATNIFSSYIPDPAHIKVYDGKPLQIFVKIINSSGCFSKSEIDISYTLAPGAIKLKTGASLTECTPDAGGAVFDLTESQSQIFDQTQNTVAAKDVSVTYYTGYDSANEQPTGIISGDYTHFTSGTKVIYAKYTSAAGCYSVVPLQLYAYPVFVGKNVTENFCENEGVILDNLPKADFFQNGYDANAPYIFTFYDNDPASANAQVVLKNSVFFPQNSTVPNMLWYTIQVQAANQTKLCFANGILKFAAQKPISVAYPGDLGGDVCDTDNDLKETISLRGREADLKKQFPDATFAYFSSFPNQPVSNPNQYVYDGNVQNFVYVKVSSAQGCPSVIKLNIVLKKTPKFILNQSVVQFCQASEKVNITPNYQPTRDLGLQLTDYVWTLPDGSKISGVSTLDSINTAGKYNLTVTANNGCTFSRDFELQAKPTPKIYQLIVEDKSVKVIATKDGNIANPVFYSMDGGTWQSSYIFENVVPGIHYFTVKYDVSDCAGFAEKTLVLAGNNAITPNGDGKNDAFVIDNLNIFNAPSSLQIFDRYGKILYSQESTSALRWDGTSNQRPVETGTYWYILKIGDGRQISGWILVKNR